MSVEELSRGNEQDWDEFVQTCGHGTFFHLSGWRRVMKDAFGLETFYLCNRSGGAITGVLPLALVRRPVFGPALISTPLCVYGGALGEADALHEAAAHKARERGVQYLELRNHHEPAPDWPVTQRFYTFRRTLSARHDDNLTAIPRKQRAEIRKAIAHGLGVRFNQDIDLFYKIYSKSVRNLGTPVFAKKYLKTLMEVFGASCEVCTVFHDNKPLTGVLNFSYQSEVLPYYGGGVTDHSAFPFMYWKVMERAVDRGAGLFDFGRSMIGSGAYAFKKNFGFEAEPLPYQYHLIRAKSPPDFDPDNPRNKLVTAAWKKMPLPLANRIGPFLYPVIM